MLLTPVLTPQTLLRSAIGPHRNSSEERTASHMHKYSNERRKNGIKCAILLRTEQWKQIYYAEKRPVSQQMSRTPITRWGMLVEHHAQYSLG